MQAPGHRAPPPWLAVPPRETAVPARGGWRASAWGRGQEAAAAAAASQASAQGRGSPRSGRSEEGGERPPLLRTCRASSLVGTTRQRRCDGGGGTGWRLASEEEG